LHQRIRRHVYHNRPVAVTVGYGPLKNPNSVPESRADWAEFFALCHLVAWHNKVQAIYPPGLTMKIAFDDATLVMANRADKGRIKSYMATGQQARPENCRR
jgi:pyoverdine/dityrosine biosynthesis protein Dit1